MLETWLIKDKTREEISPELTVFAQKQRLEKWLAEDLEALFPVEKHTHPPSRAILLTSAACSLPFLVTCALTYFHSKCIFKVSGMVVAMNKF